MPIGDIIFLLLIVLCVSVVVVIAVRSRRADGVPGLEPDSLDVNETARAGE